MNIMMSRAIQQHKQQQRLLQPPPPPQPMPHQNQANSQLSPNSKQYSPSRRPSTPISPLNFTERIPFNELKLSSETLGSGSFGTVFKGSWGKRNVAVKQFRTREEIDSFLVELKQLSNVKHPNIVTLYGASTFSDSAYLIMEYAEGGSLNYLLHENKQQEYDLRHACIWAAQTAKGVAYLHGIRPKPIMHRDLKPANLLLFSRGKILKICDFGTACTVKTQMTNNTGSASYMAPEVFATSSYLESGDVFSWSIIFWEILARTPPYSQQYSNPYQILWRVKQEGTRPNALENCPDIIWDLITICWDTDPKKRPSMRDVGEEMEIICSLTYRSSQNIKTLPKTPTNITTTTITTDIVPDADNIQQQKSLNCRIISPFDDQHFNQEQLIDQINKQFVLERSRNQEILSIIAKKELFNQRKALAHKRRLAVQRFKQLEAMVKCDKRENTYELIHEFEVLEKEQRLTKEKIKLKRSSNCTSPMTMSRSNYYL